MKEINKIKVVQIELPEGVNIGDTVHFSDAENFIYLSDSNLYTGTLKAVTSDGRFVDHDGDIWNHVKPMLERKVKPLKEFLQTLLDEGYLPNLSGEWYNKDKGRTVSANRFDYCGKEVPREGSMFDQWDESWLQVDGESDYSTPSLKKDDIVEVRDWEDCDWILRRFSHFNEDGTIYSYCNGKNSKNSMSPIAWKHWRKV